MTHLRNGKFTVITMDEGLYNKAKMLQWGKTQVLKDVIIVLGGFHTQMTFSKVIGKYLLTLMRQQLATPLKGSCRIE